MYIWIPLVLCAISLAVSAYLLAKTVRLQETMVEVTAKAKAATEAAMGTLESCEALRGEVADKWDELGETLASQKNANDAFTEGITNMMNYAGGIMRGADGAK